MGLKNIFKTNKDTWNAKMPIHAKKRFL